MVYIKKKSTQKEKPQMKNKNKTLKQKIDSSLIGDVGIAMKMLLFC